MSMHSSSALLVLVAASLAARASTHVGVTVPETQVKLGAVGGAPCGRGARGLAVNCVGICNVSVRLCKACCAAIAPLSTPAGSPGSTAAPTTSYPPSAPSVPSDEDIERMFLPKVVRCLSPCVNFTAKEVRTVLQEPQDKAEDVKDMAGQLDKAAPGNDWQQILNSGRYPSILQICERGDLDSCWQ